MRNALAALFFAILMSGCETLNSSTFRTGKVEYEDLKTNIEIIETRLYVKKSTTCDIYSTTQNTLPALAVPVLGYLAKEAVAYGKDKIDKYAEYLKSDVKLNANSLLSFGGEAWPNKELLDTLETSRKRTINASLNEAISKYKEATGTTDNTPTLSDFIKTERTRLESEETSVSEITSSANDLCLLVVAGKYGNSSPDVANKAKYVLDRFAFGSKKNTTPNAKKTLIQDYKMIAPGFSEDQSPKAFDNIIEDPSFVAEIQVVATDLGEKMQYTIKPANIFYPYSLHKYTKSDVERKLTIELTFGTHKAAVSFDSIKGGTVLKGDILASKFSMFEAPKTEKFKSVAIMVAEGPDKLPTAKLLTEISSHDKDIEKYLIDKIGELAGGKVAATEAAPK